MAKIKAVVFDMYETLVSNPIEGWMDVFEGVCRSQNLPLDHQTLYDEWKSSGGAVPQGPPEHGRPLQQPPLQELRGGVA